ncbi:MAG: NAD-binding protein [Chromatiaceae bacterium]|nr:NAD-binding protein [Chromatiaceae bacterium]MCF7993968.1 NAD-binding protein [Chromatiaceae bacterium]MCF8015664.1 NAD-binding protein [Chromatiaceae bacterium]
MNLVKLLKTLGVVIVVLAIYLGLLATLIHFEQASDEPSITNLGEAIWFSIVTMTTVGYGDMYPVTNQGKWIGYLFIIASMGVLGLLIGRISNMINEVRENHHLGYNGTSFTNHVVIIGWNRYAQTVLEQLLPAGVKIAIILDQRSQIDLLAGSYERSQVYFLLADHHNFELARKANIEAASIVFVNLDDDTDKLVYLINSKKFYHKPISHAVVVNDHELVPSFRSAGADVVLSRDEIDAKLTASFIFEPEVAKYTEELISSASEEDSFDVQQYLVMAKNRFKDRYYLDAFFEIRKQLDAILIGLATTINGERVVLGNPDDPELKISEGDYLILITSGRAAKQLQRAFGVAEGSL